MGSWPTKIRIMFVGHAERQHIGLSKFNLERFSCGAWLVSAVIAAHKSCLVHTANTNSHARRHLFSDRRRPGDVQTWFETEELYLRGNVTVAIGPVRGNLCDPDAIGRWLALIAIGVVLGAVGGPHCETWSPGGEHGGRATGAEDRGRPRARPRRRGFM